MNSEIEKLRQKCVAAGKSFIYNPNEEMDEDKQSANFYFIGKNKAKEVIFEAFLMTSRFDYQMCLMEEAENKMLEKYPELEGVDYDDYTEAQQDLYEDFCDQVYENDLIKVQEFVEVFDEGNPHQLSMEASLNVREINDKVIEQFVRDYNAGSLELDDRLHTFDMDN